MAKLYKGAHVISSRTLYSHHGIYIGNGQVIHYSGLADGLNAGPIEITTLSAFKADCDMAIGTYANPKYTGEQAVQRAKSRLGEDKYDLQANNCEHFCRWVIMGEASSSQVNLVEDVVDVVAGGAIGTAVRMRRNMKQGFEAKQTAKDVGNIAAIAAINAVFPVVLPATIGYKVLRRLLGK